MPIDYSIYPPNWKTEIVPRILKRANHRCEFSGVANKSIGYWYGMKFVTNGALVTEYYRYRKIYYKKAALRAASTNKCKLIEIVLTVCHLDRDPENWNVSDDRLKAACQKCHLNYDLPDNVNKRKYGKNYKKNQLPILPSALDQKEFDVTKI